MNEDRVKILIEDVMEGCGGCLEKAAHNSFFIKNFTSQHHDFPLHRYLIASVRNQCYPTSQAIHTSNLQKTHK